MPLSVLLICNIGFNGDETFTMLKRPLVDGLTKAVWVLMIVKMCHLVFG